jgi:hypothetical protein
MAGAAGYFAGNDEAFAGVCVVLDLPDEQVSRNVRLTGTKGAAVKAVVVENMNRDSFLGQEVE